MATTEPQPSASATDSDVQPVRQDDVRRAHERIARYVRRTPVIDHEGVVLKLELLQHAGSFKTRGAANRLLGAAQLPAAGVITASGGNHGAALAYMAAKVGVPAEVFVPSSSPQLKKDLIASLGARVNIIEGFYDDARQAAVRRAQESGAMMVHAFDHRDTVAGQGTMSAELADQVDGIDTLLIACGGGGFVAGQAAWFAGTDTQVVAVETAGCPTLHTALAAGGPAPSPVGGLAADSLGSQQVGAAPWATLRGVVTRSVLVEDADVLAAQRNLWRSLRLVAEPGGAAAWAALLSGAYRPEPGERVVVAVCGSNGDPQPVIAP